MLTCNIVNYTCMLTCQIHTYAYFLDNYVDSLDNNVDSSNNNVDECFIRFVSFVNSFNIHVLVI